MVKDPRHQHLVSFKDGPANETCPNGHKAVYRYNDKQKTMFIGCSEWPNCTFSRSLDGEWKRKSQRVRQPKQETNVPDEFICSGGYEQEE